jgi:cyclic dehypoxanthinyl futalosine synthase
MGSLMIEENVVSSAGTVHHLTLEQIKGSIRELGYVPRQRNVFYEYLDTPEAEPLPGLNLSLPLAAAN